jgi:hypothetical protein
MNNKTKSPTEAFQKALSGMKNKRRTIRFINAGPVQQKINAEWNFGVEWNMNTVQRAADFITSLGIDGTLIFWQSIGTGHCANHNIAKLHFAVSSTGILVQDHLIKILTKE